MFLLGMRSNESGQVGANARKGGKECGVPRQEAPRISKSQLAESLVIIIIFPGCRKNTEKSLYGVYTGSH